jgi:hypothetical protein
MGEFFIELSAEYFYECEGEIIYVRKTLTSFGNLTPVLTSFAPFAET